MTEACGIPEHHCGIKSSISKRGRSFGLGVGGTDFHIQTRVEREYFRSDFDICGPHPYKADRTVT